MEVKANRRDRFDDLDNPGDFILITNQAGEVVGMVEKCPCGCGELGSISFDVPSRTGCGPKWKWNGNRDKPTLTPSIKRTVGCLWHGYLTDGVFRSC